MDQEITFHWEDSIAALVGAEYWVTEVVAARAGYHFATMATSERYADPLYPPPGVVHSLHAGGGLRWTNVQADLGFAYALGGADVDEHASRPTGRYEGGFVLAGASFTYRQ